MATLAPSLRNLEREVNATWTKRDNWSDGWLGDDSHATRFSDHNPDGRGVVHAYDFDATLVKSMGSGPVGDAICARILAGCRSGRLRNVVNYIIYKGRIYSRAYNYVSRIYEGANKHFSHVHVSIMRTAFARSYSGSWGVRRTAPSNQISALNVHNAMRNKTAAKNGVAFKKAIAAEVGRGTMLLSSPGCGTATRTQYRKVQIKYLRSRGETVTSRNADGIPPSTPTGSLRWLAGRRGLRLVK